MNPLPLVMLTFLFLSPYLVTGQEIQVRGRITDTLSNPLPGVTVTVLGSTKGVVSDEAGQYRIDVERSVSLVYTFTGMEAQTIAVAGRTIIDVILKDAPDLLSEVTIVAFGQQKKESVVGSVTTVKPDELRVPSSNLTTALAGRVAGMIAFQRSGEPGMDNADFFIRGVTSFGYSNRPLILIDGVEMPVSELARLQVDDIASFSIMKDATATALYGARGANGVILITTKEGKEGKATISFRAENSLSAPTRNVELADPITYMRMANEAITTREPNGLKMYSDEKIENTMAGTHPLLYPSTDWQDMLMSDYALNQRFTMNVSGGGSVARYYVAGTFNNDQGLLKVDNRNNFNNNINLKTYSLRSNVNINLTKTTEALVRLNSTWSDYNGPINGGAEVYNQIMNTNPVLYPAFYPADERNSTNQHILFGNFDRGQHSNPYADMMRGYRDYTSAMVLAQFELKQDLGFIAKGLNFNAMYNTTRYNFYSVSRSYVPFYYSLANYNKQNGDFALSALNPDHGREYLDYAENAKDVSSESYFQGILNHSASLFRNHSISSSLVFTMLSRLQANAGSLQQSLPHRNMGLAGRFTYAMNDRYFLEANFGYNGSERFHADHRFGFFPSIGAAWYVSREKFWSDDISRIVSNLKLRGTYGLVGNDAIGTTAERFFFLSEVDMNYGPRGYTFGSDWGNTITGVIESRYGNPDITWEVARKSNISAEIGLFNTINIVAEVFREERSNILLQRTHVPNTMGLVTVPKANLGEASSSGVDGTAEFSTRFSGGWFFSGRANFTYATSRFNVFDEPDYRHVPWRSRIGYPLGQTWGYVAERLFVDDEEVLNSPTQFGQVMGGDIKFRDINNDGQINELDLVPIGFPTTPEIIYGIGVSTGYRNFDCSFFLQGSERSSFYINPVATAPFVGDPGFSRQLLQAYADSYWSEDNRDLYALWPRLAYTNNANNTAGSTWFLRNGGFLRLKQVEFGYSLPTKLLQRIQMDRLRIYVNGTNLLTFSKFKLWDPEMAGNGLGYPVQRVFNIGINCTL